MLVERCAFMPLSPMANLRGVCPVWCFLWFRLVACLCRFALTTSLVENFLVPVTAFCVPRNLPSLSACLMATAVEKQRSVRQPNTQLVRLQRRGTACAASVQHVSPPHGTSVAYL